jgi:hypothetical protein
MSNPPTTADLILRKVRRCRHWQLKHRRLGDQIRDEVADVSRAAKEKVREIFDEEMPDNEVDFYVNVEIGSLSLQWHPAIIIYDVDNVKKATRGWCYEDYVNDGAYYVVPPPFDVGKLRKAMKRIQQETGLHAELHKIKVTRVTPGLPDWMKVEKQE